MTENFPTWERNRHPDPEIPESCKEDKFNEAHKEIYCNFQKLKIRMLKAAREKYLIMYRECPMRLSVVFSAGTSSKRNRILYSKCWGEKCHSRIRYLAKVLFRTER